MAITTIDGLIAGIKQPQFIAKAASNTPVAGRTITYWATAGIPGPGSYDTTLLGTNLTSTSALVNGQIPYYNPVSGNKYLARFVGNASTAGIILLCDRLWHNGGINITSTSPQTINSAAWPARDNNGTTNGEGVYIAVEVSAQTGTGTPILSMNYTNSSNVSGRGSFNTVSTTATSVVGATYQMSLQAGDLGVKSIESFTLSATWTTGTINLVAYRILAALEVPGSGVPGSLDPLTGGLPILYNGTVPYLMFLPSSTTTARLYGQVTYAEG